LISNRSPGAKSTSSFSWVPADDSVERGPCIRESLLDRASGCGGDDEVSSEVWENCQRPSDPFPKTVVTKFHRNTIVDEQLPPFASQLREELVVGVLPDFDFELAGKPFQKSTP
jgi:hypothetical protein